MMGRQQRRCHQHLNISQIISCPGCRPCHFVCLLRHTTYRTPTCRLVRLDDLRARQHGSSRKRCMGVAVTGDEGVTRTNKKRLAIDDALQVAQKHLRCVPEGFPEGPIVGERNDLKYTSNFETRGRAFGVVLAADARAAKSQGDVQRLKCSEWRKSGCKYSISYEDTEQQGWVLVRYGDANGSCEHSHPLATSATQSMTQNLEKCIPTELVGIAQ
ncbi:MAG: hypothetical protein SGPRY_013079, partial [Prymnesium sp.]